MITWGISDTAPSPEDGLVQLAQLGKFTKGRKPPWVSQGASQADMGQRKGHIYSYDY